MKLSDYVYPDINIARSVNLERDQERTDLLESYQVSSKTIEILSRFLAALEGEKVSAWSLTGPYGMGKSAFANYLLALTGPKRGPAYNSCWENLISADEKLAGRLRKALAAEKKGFMQIPVTAAYEPINITLLRGLQEAVAKVRFPQKASIQEQLLQLFQEGIVDSQRLLLILKNISKYVKKPLLIIVDEFGKNLDYLSHHHDKGDIFIMQQLAEMESVYLFVCLHQAFDEYISGLSSVQRQEWSKIQGRFEDISFVESTGQMLYLMQKALKQVDESSFIKGIDDWAEEAKKFVDNTYMVSRQEFDVKTIANIYPLHPITALALIELCRRFAQNDRTLLAYISSGDRYALASFLNRDINDKSLLPAVGLDHLYDYFFSITTNAYMHRAESQRWLEIHDIIQNAGNPSELETAVLKTVGVLNLLSGSLGIKASLESIVSVVRFSRKEEMHEIQQQIESLLERGILLYREFAGEYRLWEGSDFDVYGKIQEKKAEMAIVSLELLLQQYLPLSPVIASRHAYDTGTVRRFERRWVDLESVNPELQPEPGYDGLFIYCFGNAQHPPLFPQHCQDNRPLLVAYTVSRTTLTGLALEVAAAMALLQEDHELKRDGVARKELKYRIKVAEQQFQQYLNKLFSPGSSEVRWYSQGIRIEIRSARQLSAEISRLCDRCYEQSPKIGNEMISYDKLSSAAARARRELIEAMATSSRKEQLGLEGFGPEVAIYRSLLLAHGLHNQDDESGLWQLSLGSEPDNQGLNNLWNTIDEHIDNADDSGIQVQDIINVLQEPPFGMKQGPIPIYIALYLSVKADDIAVFQESAYKPYMRAADVALMVKRPDLFVLKRIVSNSVEREVFQIYRKIINIAEIDGTDGLRNTTMLGVVGPLIKFINDLTPYAKTSRLVTQEAQRVRAAILNSTEPIRLLFEELPAAVNIDSNLIMSDPVNYGEELQHRLRLVLSELARAYPSLITQVQGVILNVFGYQSLHEMYMKERSRTQRLQEVCEAPDLNAVIQAFNREYSDVDIWARGIAGIIAKKPIDSWNDQDYTVFSAKIRDYADRMNQLESLASSTGLLVRKNTRLFSVTTPEGVTRRSIINTHINDQDIQQKVDEIMQLPIDKARAVLLILAEELLKDDTNVN